MGKIVWIASYPKSGSTWLRAFLHNYLSDSTTPHDINRLMDFSTGESGASLYRRLDPRPPSQFSIEDVQRMRPLVHRALAELHPNLVFVKTHNAALAVRGVPLITPEVTAGAIVIVRDPRDIAISYSHHLGISLDATIALMGDPQAATGGTDTKVYERLASWSIHVDSWTCAPGQHVHVMRYDDLIEDATETFRRMLHFLGHDAEPARLARAIGNSSFEELRRQERIGGFIERPAESRDAFFRAGRTEQWRAVLTAAQRTRIAHDHAAVMGRFGYF